MTSYNEFNPRKGIPNVRKLIAGNDIVLTPASGVGDVTIDVTGESFNEFIELIDTPSSYIGGAGLVLQINPGATAVEFGQALRTTDNPQFTDLLLTGDLTVKGTTTILDSETLIIEDNNIQIGNAVIPTDITADGGGITLLGATDKNITWVNSTSSWNFNQDVIAELQMSVGGTTSPATDISIDLKATDKALLLNQLTTISKNNLTPIGGMILYDTDLTTVEFYNGASWVSIMGGDVVGPASSIVGALSFFTDTTGKNIDDIPTITTDETNLKFIDNAKIILGSGTSSLQLFHSGANATIQNLTGNLNIVNQGTAADIVIRNTRFDGAIINELGTTTTATKFEVADSALSPLFTVLGNGQVSIGSNNPPTTSKFHVELGFSGATPIVNSVMTLESSADGFLSILAPDTNSTGILFGNATNNAHAGIHHRSDEGRLEFRNGGNLTHMSILETGSIAIGTTSPDITSLLQLDSITKGFLMPRMTNTQRNNILLPATGLEIFNITNNEPEFYNGTNWVGSSAAGGADTQIQYNNGGELAGTTGITFDGNNLLFADNSNAMFGNTQSLSVYHTGTLGVIDNSIGELKIQNFGTANGDILIWNEHVSNNIINRLGSDDFSTSFKVQGADQEDILRVVGIGRVMIGGGLVPIAQFQIDGNLNQILAGTVSVTINTALVTGVATAFQDELEVGSSIKIADEIFTVLNISSQTSLTLDSNHSTGASGVSAFRDSDFVSIHNGDGKIVFKIDEDSRVGVGISQINGKFNVADGTSGATAQPGAVIVAESDSDSHMIFLAPDAFDSGIVFGTELNNDQAGIFFNDALARGGLLLRVEGSPMALVIDSTGNVGMGTGTPDALAILDLTSITRGFLMPRMSTTQRNAIITPPAGLEIYNTTVNEPEFYNGAGWVNTDTPPGGLDNQLQYNNDGVFAGTGGINFTSFGRLKFDTSSVLSFGDNEELQIDYGFGVASFVNSTGGFDFIQNGGEDMLFKNFGLLNSTVFSTGTSNSATSIKFIDNVGSTLAVFSGDGNVGIGIPLPLSRLHIGDLTSDTEFLRIDSAGGARVQLAALNPATGASFVGVIDNTDFDIVTNNISRVRVKAGGNVGIGTGTQAVQQKLHLSNGSIFIENISNGNGLLFRTELNGIINGSVSLVSAGVSSGYLQLTDEQDTPLVFLRGGRVGSGEPFPESAAILEITSTIKGFLLPRMSTAQRDAIIGPVVGLEIFNNVNIIPEFYDGTNWVATGRIPNIVRTIPIILNDEVDIGSYTFTQGAASLFISITVAAVNFSTSKEYLLPISFDQSAGVWVTVLPTSDTGAFASNNFDLDVKVDELVTSLRIRRTAGSTAAQALIVIKQEGSNTDIFTPSTATSSVTAPTSFYENTVLTQVNNKVGIKTSTPNTELDVNGEITMRTGAVAGYINVSDATGKMIWTEPNEAAGLIEVSFDSEATGLQFILSIPQVDVFWDADNWLIKLVSTSISPNELGWVMNRSGVNGENIVTPNPDIQNSEGLVALTGVGTSMFMTATGLVDTALDLQDRLQEMHLDINLYSTDIASFNITIDIYSRGNNKSGGVDILAHLQNSTLSPLRASSSPILYYWKFGNKYLSGTTLSSPYANATAPSLNLDPLELVNGATVGNADGTGGNNALTLVSANSENATFTPSFNIGGDTTIDFYVKYDSFVVNSRVLSIKNTDAGTKDDILVGIRGTGNFVYASFIGTTTTGAIIEISSAFLHPIGVWTRITITISASGDVNIYKDGVLFLTPLTPISGIVIQNTQNAGIPSVARNEGRIGFQPQSGAYLDGSISELRIHNEVIVP